MMQGPRRVTLTAASIALLAGAALLPATAGVMAQEGPGRAPAEIGNRPDAKHDELLVKFRPGTPAAERAAAHQRANGREVREVAGLDVKVVQVPRGQAAQRLTAYQGNPNVEYVEFNGMAYALEADPLYGQQWALRDAAGDRDIDAPRAWTTTRGNSSVRIAILDTGVRADHPNADGSSYSVPGGTHEDLLRPGTTESKLVHGVNWTWMDAEERDGSGNLLPNRPATVDRHGHGTHVAGIAAAATDNGEGIAGACPNCSLVAIKVLNDDGGGAYDQIANGVLDAVGCAERVGTSCVGERKAEILNLSLGGTYNSITLQDAVNKAWERGTVVVAAAGNENSSRSVYPAAYPRVIAVAATDSQDRKASFSNFGNWVDLAAPGVGIWSAVRSGTDTYEAWNGTSMAAPYVAGVAGLTWSAVCSGRADPQQCVRSALENQADSINGTGRYWAKGRLNACKAVRSSGRDGGPTTCQ